MPSPWTPWSLHIRTMLRALERLEGHGYSFGSPSSRHPGDLRADGRRRSNCRIARRPQRTRKPLEHAYYSGGLRYQIWVTAPDGGEVPLIDGGAFDWLTRLANNRRAVFIATGAGAQLIVSRFRQGRARLPVMSD